MQQRVFIFDEQRCFGCNGCTAACAGTNKTPAGLLWRTVHKLPPEQGASTTVYLSIACNHCEHPPCVEACPANALMKRKQDGIVIHDPDKCIGCRYCQMACPYDAIKWNPVEGLVSKCHFCYERIDQGLEPACVETCFGGALLQKVIEHDYELDHYQRQTIGLYNFESVSPGLLIIRQDQENRPPRIKEFPPPIMESKQKTGGKNEN